MNTHDRTGSLILTCGFQNLLLCWSLALTVCFTCPYFPPFLKTNTDTCWHNLKSKADWRWSVITDCIEDDAASNFQSMSKTRKLLSLKSEALAEMPWHGFLFNDQQGVPPGWRHFCPLLCDIRKCFHDNFMVSNTNVMWLKFILVIGHKRLVSDRTLEWLFSLGCDCDSAQLEDSQ